jgi:hypothetical protein
VRKRNLEGYEVLIMMQFASGCYSEKLNPFLLEFCEEKKLGGI